MRFQVSRGLLMLGLSFLVVGCVSEPDLQMTTQDLGDRLQARLEPDLMTGAATLERLPNGARVTISDQTMFPRYGGDMDDKGRAALTRVIQALLDPNLQQVTITDSAPTPAQQGQRTRAVSKFFDDHGLGGLIADTDLPPVVTPSGVTPQGITITVSVVPPTPS